MGREGWQWDREIFLWWVMGSCVERMGAYRSDLRWFDLSNTLDLKIRIDRLLIYLLNLYLDTSSIGPRT